MPLPFNPPPPRSQLTELEKKREENIRRNEEMLISLGLLAPNGSFFQAKKRSKQLLMESESESSEDEEWTPQAEWQKRMKKQPRTSFDEVERYKAKAAKAGATKKQVCACCISVQSFLTFATISRCVKCRMASNGAVSAAVVCSHCHTSQYWKTQYGLMTIGVQFSSIAWTGSQSLFTISVAELRPSIIGRKETMLVSGKHCELGDCLYA
eukprot:scpid93019/ scgid7890/ 